ncbi:MAG TPA: BtrH N-terminal domain-containing protein [Acidiferrobacter sp.]|nr:BtrH N-terminal domain-containing protein [Acidiferrobacter sp.]
MTERPAGSFVHRHAAHCESGTLDALLRDRGLDLTESMLFGIGGGLFFLHTGLIKVGGMPLTSYRGAPLSIARNACRRLGIPMRYQHFRKPRDAQAALDSLLAAGVSVGLQTCVYWLPYFPDDMRFQFNAHNLVAVARSEEGYLLSDPVFEDMVTCSADALQRARFARGAFAPRGLIYYPESIPKELPLARAIRQALRHTCRQMLDIPVLPIGIRGMHRLARQLAQWPQKFGDKRARAYIANVIRMQEEIGTGGAGFRFMFAAFLQEASTVIDQPLLGELSTTMTAIGDQWRRFAVAGARLCQGADSGTGAWTLLAAMVEDCATAEEQLFRRLRAAL